MPQADGEGMKNLTGESCVETMVLVVWWDRRAASRFGQLFFDR